MQQKKPRAKSAKSKNRKVCDFFTGHQIRVGVVGGRSETLGEFAIAYESGKLIGVLHGTGGITGALETIQTSLNKQTGSEILHDTDPKRLVARLLK